MGSSHGCGSSEGLCSSYLGKLLYFCQALQPYPVPSGGCRVWLNSPAFSFEGCGTSGDSEVSRVSDFLRGSCESVGVDTCSGLTDWGFTCQDGCSCQISSFWNSAGFLFRYCLPIWAGAGSSEPLRVSLVGLLRRLFGFCSRERGSFFYCVDCTLTE